MSLALHEAVFSGDLKQLSQLLRTQDVTQKDKHGNTPLHLSVMLGRKVIVIHKFAEFTQLLLAHGAPVKVKNLQGWSPLAEAISYGDRSTIHLLLWKLKKQARDQMEHRRPNLVKALQQMGDFYMELKWDFQSWVPLVSRILPSDICKIHKAGCSIRLDTTLVDFSEMKWERGDISFIFRGDKTPKESLTVLDNEYQCYQRVRYEETEAEIEDEVDILMSSDIMAAQMSTKSINFTRAQSGWIFREDRKETIAGQYECDLYCINGLVLESRKRREHLSRDDLQKNKALMESFTKGHSQTVDQNGEILRRTSLSPPPNCNVTWDEYINAEPGEHPKLARDLVYKESSKTFRATVAMSKDFPLNVEMLLNVLEVIAPFKHFSKLREFVTLKLPSGFPVKIDIPILPTVTAKITFQKFEFRDNIPQSMFEVPETYVEDNMRFPDL
ncbi:ankyrin repeat domain-containing protein 13C isoform X2 [Phlebotomus papatasi]|uniref:ankyrin repeat domain-containing protein 13C isoform X2 n=1 Tax=Phlebotomus papatasi TaxID=29031 RepID=UPI0024845C02|nr:ankyrin repeat domain-containing protein 13C isoform X2 [Phlebotomus papatasi]